MAEVPTFLDLYALAKTAALLRSTKLTEASFAPGFMLDVLAGMDAAAAEEVIRYALDLHARTFVSTATGVHLDALAEDHFSLTRRTGAGAVGRVRFSRPTAAQGPVLIEVGTTLETPEGIRFRTIEAGILTALTTTIGVIAAEIGEQGNVAPGKITVIVDTLSDSSITVTNLQKGAGGIGPETDDAFRKRIREYLVTLRRGTVDALAFGAKIPGVVEASVDDSVYPPSVYVADASGGANDDLIAAVVEELVNWRAAGVHVNVFGAVVVEQEIEASITYRAGFDTSDTRAKIVEALLAEVGKLEIGERLYRSALIAAAKVPGVVNVVMTEPAGDVQPAKNELLRTTTSLILVN